MCNEITTTTQFNNWTPAYKVTMSLLSPVDYVYSELGDLRINSYVVFKEVNVLQEFTGPFSLTPFEYKKVLVAKCERYGIKRSCKGDSDYIGFCVLPTVKGAREYLKSISGMYIHKDPDPEAFPPCKLHIRRVKVKGEIHKGDISGIPSWMAEKIKFFGRVQDV